MKRGRFVDFFKSKSVYSQFGSYEGVLVEVSIVPVCPPVNASPVHYEVVMD